MKLSELVAFRNELNKLSLVEPKQLAQSKLDIIMHTIEEPRSDSIKSLVESSTPELYSNLTEAYQALGKFSSNVEKIKKQIHEQIIEHEKKWFQESYNLFELAEDCETTDQILYGRTPTGEKSEQAIEAEVTLKSRLSAYAVWRWPGMIIRPATENYVENMVGCDPLYIIDRNYDLLKPCLNRFPKLYQNRLRPYTTNDWNDTPILERIPNDQFGICLAYNVFNYRPLEIIRRYLEEIYQKLRPGGALIMTYNDCDRTHGVILVEQFAASYTPGYLIRDLATNVGFEQVFTWSDGGPSVWLELRKPGELVSNRGGQVISAITQIDNYLDDIDFLKRKVYTDKEVESLRERAADLNIEQATIDQMCSTYPYELEVLINVTNARIRQEAEEQAKHEKMLEYAREFNVDINLPDWKDTLDVILAQKEQERLKQEEEQRIIAIELEKKRILDLHERARSYNINPTLYDREEEIHRLIAEAIDQQKKDELRRLRQRAMELQAGDPNLIKYGYSAEKLKQLIKAKEEE